MRKIKIFSDANEAQVEKRMNQWLSEHPLAIIFHTLQSESFNSQIGFWSLTITIFYYEGEQGQ